MILLFKLIFLIFLELLCALQSHDSFFIPSYLLGVLSYGLILDLNEIVLFEHRDIYYIVFWLILSLKFPFILNKLSTLKINRWCKGALLEFLKLLIKCRSSDRSLLRILKIHSLCFTKLPQSIMSFGFISIRTNFLGTLVIGISLPWLIMLRLLVNLRLKCAFSQGICFYHLLILTDLLLL